MKWEVGKKYRWIGPEKPTEYGIPEELSEIWEKGKPHELLFENGPRKMIFKGICRGIWKKDIPWAYDGFEDNFKEVLTP